MSEGLGSLRTVVRVRDGRAARTDRTSGERLTDKGKPHQKPTCYGMLLLLPLMLHSSPPNAHTATTKSPSLLAPIWLLTRCLSSLHELVSSFHSAAEGRLNC